MAKQSKLRSAALYSGLALSAVVALPVAGLLSASHAYALEANAGDMKLAAKLAKEGDAAFTSRNYALAADSYAKATAALDASAAQRELKQFYLQSEAEALFQQGDELGDNAALIKAIERQTSLLAMLDRAKSPLNFANIENDLANSMAVLGGREGEPDRLKQAIATYEDVMSLRNRDTAPLDWARTQNDMGVAKLMLGERSEDDKLLEDSIEIFRTAAEVCGRQNEATEWARSRSNLGHALRTLGARRSDLEMLNQAVDVLDDAMKVRTRESDPKGWAESQLYLANAKRAIGDILGDEALLLTTLHLYSQSLEVFTREKYPLDWAQTKLDLGNAQIHIGQRQSGLMYLSLAVNSLRDSLKERSPERTPLQWGMSQNNLGAALGIIALRETNSSTLRNAIAAYRAAASQMTRERDPVNWAMAERNIGSNLLTLWDRERPKRQKDFENANAAIIEQQVAAAVPATLADHEKALRAIVDKQQGAELLDEAIAALEDAGKVYTKEQRTSDWAITQSLLVEALTKNPFTGPDWLNKGTVQHLKAIDINKDLQGVYTRKQFPVYWGRYEKSIGDSQFAIGNQRDDKAFLKDSVETLRTARDTLISNQDLEGWIDAQSMLFEVLDKLGDKETDVGSYLEAVSVIDKLKAAKAAEGNIQANEWYESRKAEILAKIKQRNG
jgi:tetratricopeptide (TPR) repeat protein